MVAPFRMDLATHLDDALWAYMAAYKKPLGISPYKIVCERAFHLPLELQHKLFWAIKKLSLNFEKAGATWMLQFNELKEMRNFTYKNVELHEEKTKGSHDRKIQKRDLKEGDMFCY